MNVNSQSVDTQNSTHLLDATNDYTPTPPGHDVSIVPAGYQFLGLLGGGGMGIVYKARRLDLNRVEALKMIRSGEFAGARELARFRFEAEATAGLEHPNIVTVYGVGETATQPYLALRYIEGTSLAELLRNKGQLPQHQAAVIVEKVARAVHFAHQHGILHRDLKPGNILLDQAGEPYVGDFGVARRLDASQTMTEQGAIVGTVAYMAPEQACGERNPTAAADVYALGVVLYEALTGQTPFKAQNTYDLLRQVIEAEPPAVCSLTTNVDADLEAICAKCLEKDPTARYASAAELAEDLERFRRGEPVSAQPPGFWDWLNQLMRTQPEPNVCYAWQVTAWFGAIVLLSNVAIFEMARINAPSLGVWLVNFAQGFLMALVLWWYLLRRFRSVVLTERHSLVIAFGHINVCLLLTLTYVPFSLTTSARDCMAMYPALTGVSGLGLFTLGSTNWARFFTLGLGVTALAPVMAWWPDAAPLLYGGVNACVMWYWSHVKRVGIVGTRATARK